MFSARCDESESELEHASDSEFTTDVRSGDLAVDESPAPRTDARGDLAESGEMSERELLADGSFHGWPGCRAARLREALESPTSEIVLTDERLLVVEANGVDEPETELSIERSDVERICRQARFLEPGRVAIRLKDGSILALQVGLLGGKSAQRLVDTWRKTQTQS